MHTSVHTEAKPYECGVCQEKFRTAGHKRSHEQSHRKGLRKGGNGAKMGSLLGSVVMEGSGLGEGVMAEGVSRDEIIFVQNTVS